VRLLGVTTYLTTDIAAVPLLWVIPLAIYLLSFILVFARRSLLPHALLCRAWPAVRIVASRVNTKRTAFSVGNLGSMAGLGGSGSAGTGGGGGLGKAVTVTNQGIISTTGTGSVGIRAQSVGGGGGDAGLVANLSISSPGGSAASNQIAVNIGGDGGSGGRSGDVSVTNSAGGQIQTLGAKAYGIFAQSLGGGGGNGSSIVSANFLSGGANSFSAGMNIGGAGGTGNTSGNVIVTNQSIIDTTGDGAHGIFAQSIGGGGGNGGMILAVNAVLADSGGAPLIVVGGSGGNGANAGNVTVTNSGQITTRGDQANGIFAQSIGGGGGNAGVGIGLTTGAASTVIANTISAAVGAVSGGTGGLGGAVTVNHSGNIVVFGRGSQAIKAESINGGGGDVVLDFNGITSLPGGEALPGAPGGVTTAPVLVLRAGGQQTVNSTAGAVTVNMTGTIGVVGDDGAGNSIQAIGGGGGNIQLMLNVADQAASFSALQSGVGANSRLAIQATSLSDPLQIQNNLGGNGGSGNKGGDINSTQIGDIYTQGSNTPGLLLQTIGGGGGRANLSISSFFGEIGGITLGLGGTASSDNAGGVINHTQTGSFETTGDQSFGVLAQSVGGGGGVTNLLNRQTLSLNTNATQLAAPPLGPNLSVSLGSNVGTNNPGGAVAFTMAGNTLTQGTNSLGLFYQSVGAGGGTSTIDGVNSINVSLGGSGGASGSGGSVTLYNTGSVSTAGFRAHGIFLQSVGGGGGSVFTDAANIAVNTSANNTGNGGAIVLQQQGNVVTRGEQTFGLFAQSVGGGGGFVDGAFRGTAGGNGSGGTIDMRVDGSVVTLGGGSTGLFAQSVGSTGGDISITLNNPNGMITGGSGGTGVAFSGGATNNLANAGLVTTLDYVDGLAISGTTGSERIDNYGVVAGSVDLGGGANAFNNKLNALFVSGSVVNLGSGNSLNNEGLLSPGDWQRVLTTNLTGNLLQTASGFYGVDLDLNLVTADRINVTQSAIVSGVVAVNLRDPLHAAAGAKPGTHDIVIVSANGGETHPGISLQAIQTAVVTQSLIYPNSNDIVLRHVIDYSPAGLTSTNQHSVGNAINAIQAAQTSTAFAPLATALFFQPNAKALGSAFDSLSGSETSGTQQVSFTANDLLMSSAERQMALWAANDNSDPNSVTLFGDQALGYADPKSGRGAQGSLGANSARQAILGVPRALPPRTWRLWVNGYRSTAFTEGNPTIGSVDSRSSGGGFAGGIDYQIAPNAIIGMTAGWGEFGFNARDRQTNGATQAGHIGAYGALKSGNFYTTGVLAVGFFGNDINRFAAVPGMMLPLPGGNVGIPGFSENLTGHFNSRSFSGSFEAGYKAQYGALEVMPFAGLQFGVLGNDGYTERSIFGQSQLGLNYATRTIASLPTFLGLQLKTQTDLGKNIWLSSSVRAAWKSEWLSDRSTESSFIAAPGFFFTVQGAQPARDALRVSITEKLKLNQNISMFAGFNGDFARTGQSYFGTLGIGAQW